MPTEEEQYHTYRQWAVGKLVTIRRLDAGGMRLFGEIAPLLVLCQAKRPSFPIASRDDGRELNGSRATFLWSDVARLAVRLFLCFCIFTPFDTARRSDGKGPLRARRRIGY